MTARPELWGLCSTCSRWFYVGMRDWANASCPVCAMPAHVIVDRAQEQPAVG